MRNVIFTLLALLLILGIWRADYSGKGRPEWQHCKESLFTQVVFNKCTLIYEGETNPA